MNRAVVEISDVTKTFDDLVAVDSISLRVDRGQTLGLIGPNGAGKTTLLRIISSLAKPDRGDVVIDGESVRSNPRAVRRKLGFMPAEFGSPRSQTIGEYLTYFACLHGITKTERDSRIKDVCELTDLTGREDVMVKGLSTGNKQRLLLAKTLLHDPELLVLDEPASGLDPRARTELRAIMRALASMGKTIIISSHILPDIQETCDRIGIIEAGKLVLDGDFESIRSDQGSALQVRLQVPKEHTQRAFEVVSKLPEVGQCELVDQFIVVKTNDPIGNKILAAMLQLDIRILHFSEDAPNLEQIFMQTTAGKVT